MKRKKFKRFFKENNSYVSYNKLPHIDPLAYVAETYLYTDKAEGDENDYYSSFQLTQYIALYDFMSLAVYFIHASCCRHPTATIEEYIYSLGFPNTLTDMEVNYEDSGESMWISNCITELHIALLWITYIYCEMLCFENDNAPIWVERVETIKKLMKKHTGLVDDVVDQKVHLFKLTDEAKKLMAKRIVKECNELTEKKKKEKKEKKEQAQQANKMCNDGMTEKTKLDASVYEKRIKELEAEIEEMKHQREEPAKESLDWLEEWQQLSTRELCIFFAQALGVSLDPKFINQKQLANLVATWTKPKPDTIRTKIGMLFKEESEINEEKRDYFSNKTKDEALNVYYFVIRIAKYYSSITPQMNKILDNLNEIYKLGIVDKVDVNNSEKQITKKDLFDTIDNARKSGNQT